MTDRNGSLSAELVLETLVGQGSTLSVAESLTGGLLSAAVVDIPGASDAYRGGVTVYATDTKAEVLGVDRKLLDEVGPVDPQVAVQMARGAAALFGSDWAVATTGVAGPGDTEDGPQGLVYIGIVGPGVEKATRHQFAGGRSEVREEAVDESLRALVNCLLTSASN